MNSRITAAIAVVGILAVGGVGYLVGTSQNRPAARPRRHRPGGERDAGHRRLLPRWPSSRATSARNWKASSATT